MLRPSHGRPDPDRRRRRSPSRSAGLVEARSAGGAPNCWSAPASRKQGDKWMTPDGKPFADHASMVEGERRPVMTRAGSDDRAAVAPVRHRRHDRRRAGHAWSTAAPPATSTPSSAGASRPGAATPTCRSSSTAGTRSSSPPPGKPQPPRNWQRWTQPRARQDHRAGPHDRLRRSQGPRARPEYVKLAVREMPIIPLMSYNVFTVMDDDLLDRLPERGEIPTPTRCRTGPTRKYMMVKLKPTQ